MTSLASILIRHSRKAARAVAGSLTREDAISMFKTVLAIMVGCVLSFVHLTGREFSPTYYLIPLVVVGTFPGGTIGANLEACVLTILGALTGALLSGATLAASRFYLPGLLMLVWVNIMVFTYIRARYPRLGPLAGSAGVAVAGAVLKGYMVETVSFMGAVKSYSMGAGLSLFISLVVFPRLARSNVILESEKAVNLVIVNMESRLAAILANADKPVTATTPDIAEDMVRGELARDPFDDHVLSLTSAQLKALQNNQQSQSHLDGAAMSMALDSIHMGQHMPYHDLEKPSVSCRFDPNKLPMDSANIETICYNIAYYFGFTSISAIKRRSLRHLVESIRIISVIVDSINPQVIHWITRNDPSTQKQARLVGALCVVTRPIVEGSWNMLKKCHASLSGCKDPALCVTSDDIDVLTELMRMFDFHTADFVGGLREPTKDTIERFNALFDVMFSARRIAMESCGLASYILRPLENPTLTNIFFRATNHYAHRLLVDDDESSPSAPPSHRDSSMDENIDLTSMNDPSSNLLAEQTSSQSPLRAHEVPTQTDDAPSLPKLRFKVETRSIPSSVASAPTPVSPISQTSLTAKKFWPRIRKLFRTNNVDLIHHDHFGRFDSDSPIVDRVPPYEGNPDSWRYRMWLVSQLLVSADMFYCVKTACLSTFIVYFALGLQADGYNWSTLCGYYALLIVNILAQPFVGQIMWLSLLRAIGASAGCFFAYLTMIASPENGYGLCMLTIFFLSFTIYHRLRWAVYAAIANTAQLSYILAVLSRYNCTSLAPAFCFSAGEFVLYQFLSIQTAIVVVLIASRVLYPYLARIELRTLTAKVVISLGLQFSTVMATFFAGKAPASMKDMRSSDAENFMSDAIARLDLLLDATRHEPRLKGPFMVTHYEDLIVTLRAAWLQIVRMRFAIECGLLDREYNQAPIHKDNVWHGKEAMLLRQQFWQALYTYMYMISGAIASKTPLPSQTPDVTEICERLIVHYAKVLQQHLSPEVSGYSGQHGLLYFGSYAWQAKHLTLTVEHLGVVVKTMFGVSNRVQLAVALRRQHDESV